MRKNFSQILAIKLPQIWCDQESIFEFQITSDSKKDTRNPVETGVSLEKSEKTTLEHQMPRGRTHLRESSWVVVNKDECVANFLSFGLIRDFPGSFEGSVSPRYLNQHFDDPRLQSLVQRS